MPTNKTGIKKRSISSITGVVKRFIVSQLLVYGSILFIIFIVACALFPEWIAPYSPTVMMPSHILQPPNAVHLFGTDFLGRDVFSVVVHGSRDSLLIGVASVIAGGIIGGTIGVLAGYIEGFFDIIVMRLVEIIMTIPGILLALAIAAALKPSLFNIVLAVAISAVPGYARVLRGQILSIKRRSFITAARSIGTSRIQIFVRHVLPNSWSPLLVMATIGMGTSILVGSSLSFLGLGIIKEIPDWGSLLSQGRSYLTVAWWMSTFPGLIITMLVLSVNLLGDHLRDYLDPKSSRI
ncbi:ABC transporter permease [Paenibacillus periandrae]|uniref:ABC transporter permease n=1 Tax=Paenibacillus periandrae TaxID=1761741 RepID=UPI001F099B8A|nr:ABC transporter permease [Paenibacillus periandrae]